ncbi:MAG: hypothetical protein K8S55_07150 [Phycisphaerae bacterium]|nr:hypothetical protein [Phycisphaerae bacterium]
MKSYFCQKCGRSYNHNECLQDGYRLYCVGCAKGRIVIAGWPLILIGIFLIVMSIMVRSMQNAGRYWIFIPSGVGICLVGLLKILQEKLARKNAPKEDPLDMEIKIPQQGQPCQAPCPPEEQKVDEKEKEDSTPIDPPVM